MILIYLFGALILSLLIYLLYTLHYPANYDVMNPLCDGVQGVKAIPIIGQFVYPPTSEKVTNLIREKIKKHGSPVYGKIGPMYGCIISTAEHAEILLSQQHNIEKAYLYDFFKPFFDNGLFTSKGSEWHRQRKMLRSGYNFSILKDSIPAMVEKLKSIKASILCDVIRNKSQSGQPLEVENLATRVALDTIMATSFGRTLNQQSDSSNNDYAKYMAELIDLFINRAISPFLWADFSWNLSSRGRRSQKALKFLKEFSAQMIRERDVAENTNPTIELGDNEGTQKRAFLDFLWDLKQQGQMTISEVHQQVDTFIFGGYDTVAHAVTWALWSLAAHTEAQDKVRQELSDVLGDNQSFAPSKAELSEMKWLECCIKESLRLFPAAPFLGRDTDSPICFDGKNTLPVSTIIGVDLYHIQRDPKHWPEPDLYKPERFLPENSKGRHPYSFIPFSAGIRNCVGQNYAMVSVKVILAHIVRDFMMSTDQAYDEKDTRYAIILKPKNGIWIKFKNIL